jgi:hypothetical protein
MSWRILTGRAVIGAFWELFWAMIIEHDRDLPEDERSFDAPFRLRRSTTVLKAATVSCELPLQ